MQEDLNSSLRLAAVISIIVSLISLVLCLSSIFANVSKTGVTTLTKVKEEVQKEEIKGIIIEKDTGSVNLVKGPQKEAVIEELSLSLVIDHVLGDYTKDEVREWGNSYTPSQWFKWAFLLSAKIVVIGILLVLVTIILVNYLVRRFDRAEGSAREIADVEYTEENISDYDEDNRFL